MRKVKVLFKRIVMFSVFSYSISACSLKTTQNNIINGQIINDSLSFILNKYIYKVSPFFESI